MDDTIVTADSIIEGYRRHDFADIPIVLGDNCSLVTDNSLSVMVRPSTPGPSVPRRSPLAVAGKWLVIAFLVIVIFGFGFVAGLWEMDREWRPIAIQQRAEIAKTKEDGIAAYVRLMTQAREAVMGRDMLLDAAAREVQRLNSVNKWLQGKFNASL